MWWVLVGCGSAGGPVLADPVPAAPVAVTQPVVADDLGAQVFAARCAACHGATGRGDGPAAAGMQPPPRDLSRPRLPEERRPPSRAVVIAEGKPGTAMPAWSGVLTADELAAVQQFVQQLAHAGGAVCPGGACPDAEACPTGR
ncbi:MAG: cytochrome c [Myxococcota bacterium]